MEIPAIYQQDLVSPLLNITVPTILLIVYLAIMFIITHIKKDLSIANFAWGGAVLLITLYTFVANTFYARHLLITALITLWAVRLATFVYLRYKKGADPRYVTWQDQKGTAAVLFALAWIFMLNGGFGIIMSLPSFAVNSSSIPGLNLLDLLGTLIWLKGFYWESVSDYQLFSFMKNPANKGKIMDQGLWQYSRHPNYFGEITMWWGVYLIALSVYYGWLTIIAPIAITITMCFVTGIPMNEKPMEHNPEYQAYKKRTSALIPWWPKK